MRFSRSLCIYTYVHVECICLCVYVYMYMWHIHKHMYMYIVYVHMYLFSAPAACNILVCDNSSSSATGSPVLVPGLFLCVLGFAPARPCRVRVAFRIFPRLIT